MRAEKQLQYIINKIPKPQTVFDFIQEKGQLSDEDMYATFNMGAGFAIFVSAKDADSVLAIGKEQNIAIIHAGEVRDGEKQVIIKPKNITFSAETLQVR